MLKLHGKSMTVSLEHPNWSICISSIVYRDLKPDNIGFDVRGDVKLFDFGLAKEMRPEDLVSDDLYDMSGNTGMY